jgi:hypothetical protein
MHLPDAIPGYLKRFYSNAAIWKFPSREQKEGREVRKKGQHIPLKTMRVTLSDPHQAKPGFFMADKGLKPPLQQSILPT